MGVCVCVCICVYVYVMYLYMCMHMYVYVYVDACRTRVKCSCWWVQEAKGCAPPPPCRVPNTPWHALPGVVCGRGGGGGDALCFPLKIYWFGPRDDVWAPCIGDAEILLSKGKVSSFPIVLAFEFSSVWVVWSCFFVSVLLEHLWKSHKGLSATLD